ncbi:MAG TPA: hypothetical protein VIM70_06115 [Clostridium sp.]|uniref:hypothetical protein n=1 Tax=Clostridium sp. TaxID=1506 RepID=UPI002F93C5F8
MSLGLIWILSYIISIMIVGVIMGSSFILFDYGSHISMVKSRKKYGRASYKIFMEEFYRCDWKQDTFFKKSLFDRETDSQLHAYIIEFDGIGMIMKNPIEYCKMRLFVRSYLKTLNHVKEYIWE